MGYSMKWLRENLGITRHMIRYYEEKGLLPKNPCNEYHDFDEADIKRIWGIKMFLSIGYSTTEIRESINNPERSFLESISNKIEQLEKQRKDIECHLEFAKTIKMLGRIPNVTKMGNVKFDDFISYAMKAWNGYNDSETSIFFKGLDIIKKSAEDLDKNDLNVLLELIEHITAEQMVQMQTIGGYYRVLTDMKNLDPQNKVVQGIVELLYKYVRDNMIEEEIKCKFTPLYFADHFISNFIESGVAELNEKQYGKDGCMFIAQSIAIFGGYDISGNL